MHERYIFDRNFGCRVSTDYIFRGWRLLVLENDLLRVTVLLDKGTDIWEFLYKPSDTDFMWRAPHSLPERAWSIPSSAQDAGTFMDYYEGGWQELVPQGGAGPVYKGIPFGMHGESWNLPWQCVIEKDDPDEVVARCSCRLRLTPFHIEKRFTLRRGEAVLHIDEKLTNESPEPLAYMWGHHPAFGAPFLNENCVLDVPAERCHVWSFPEDEGRRFERGGDFPWPDLTSRTGEIIDASRLPAMDAVASEELALLGLREGWYGLTDTKRKLGFGLAWDLEAFPYLWFWQAINVPDYPWFGRTYNVAVEPWNSYPMFGIDETIKHGTARTLGPGESTTAWLKAAAYQGIERVRSTSDLGLRISD